MNHHTSDGITHDDESINKATPSEDEEDMTPTVWLCLQCAHQVHFLNGIMGVFFILSSKFTIIWYS